MAAGELKRGDVSILKALVAENESERVEGEDDVAKPPRKRRKKAVPGARDPDRMLNALHFLQKTTRRYYSRRAAKRCLSPLKMVWRIPTQCCIPLTSSRG